MLGIVAGGHDDDATRKMPRESDLRRRDFVLRRHLSDEWVFAHRSVSYDKSVDLFASFLIHA